MPSKKATRKQIETVLGNLIQDVRAVAGTLNLYIDYNKDGEKFSQFIKEKGKALNNEKERTSSGVSSKWWEQVYHKRGSSGAR